MCIGNLPVVMNESTICQQAGTDNNGKRMVNDLQRHPPQALHASDFKPI